MASDLEALAQLARLLGQERVRNASLEDARTAIDAGFERLADGIFGEASASDDVIDRDSALAFVHDRVRFLGPLLRDDQRELLLEALAERVSSW